MRNVDGMTEESMAGSAVSSDWSGMDPDRILTNAITPAALPNVLILTPVKDAARWIKDYFQRVLALAYPSALISFGMLESDSRDRTFQLASKQIETAGDRLAGARLWKRDFGYQIPERHVRGMPARSNRNVARSWPEAEIICSFMPWRTRTGCSGSTSM